MSLIRYLFLLLITASLSGCCYGILCDGCDPVANGITINFDTTAQNGFTLDQLDSTKLISLYPNISPDTIYILKRKLQNDYSYSLETGINATYRILQKDSLFNVLISNFVYEKVDVEEGGCCNCGDYYILKSFDVDGKTLTEGPLIISR